MKKKIGCFLCCLLMIMAAAAPALAAARMPENRGVLTDDADVLSAQTAKDIAEYAELAEDQTDVRLHVVIVHFLDGVEVQAYADRLFRTWELGDDDLLLLGAAGEDSFATALGSDVKDKLGEKNAQNLMYLSSAFGDLFKSQQYDLAFGKYFVALNDMLNKQYDKKMELGQLFAAARENGQVAAPAPTQRAADYTSQLWQQVMGSIDSNTADYQAYQESRQYQENGIGVGGWVILAILIMIIFGQSDPIRKARNAGRTHYRDYGCGCSPLGWILAMLGLGTLIDRLRGRRR